MNDVDFFVKNVTIIVQLDGYDDKDFDVIIKAGNNETKVCTVRNRFVVNRNSFVITYQGLHYFTLDSLKITCKYPVIVRCNAFTINKYYEPIKNPQITLMNGAGDILELEGTEKQIEAFEEEWKKRKEALFPRVLSATKTAELALEYGLTVKKVTTRK